MSTKVYSRRKLLEMIASASGIFLSGVNPTRAQYKNRVPVRSITVDAKPEAILIDLARTAVVVVDMQNDFGAEGGMFHRAGVDISMIRAAVAPTARVLDAARKAGIKIIYLKMGFKPDLSDAGASDSPILYRALKKFKFGARVKAPNGANSRIFIKDTWNTDILSELTPKAQDIILYKHRFSGFFQTELDSTLRRLNVVNLIFTGCTTSVCVESTIRDARFRDYAAVVLADCTGEPVGSEFPRSNHEASLFLIQSTFGWVSSSHDLISGLEST
ncbi:MAG TPA: cysteine hydrolase [Pyrinomonadaceae bacterium]|nr:cysteine hydrolase [Pyrinomonadaceae bacterium]